VCVCVCVCVCVFVCECVCVWREWQEVRNRLSCRMALEAELSLLRSTNTVDVSEEGGTPSIYLHPTD